MKYPYISFSGPDFAGKSSLIMMVAEKMEKNPMILREPGQTPAGKEIRKLAVSGLKLNQTARDLLFIADRVQTSSELIAPNKGDITILSDRSMYDGAVYSGKVKDNGEVDSSFIRLHEDVICSDNFPDAVIIVTAKHDTIVERFRENNRGDTNSLDRFGVENSAKITRDLEKMCRYMDVPYITIDTTDSFDSALNEAMAFIYRLKRDD